MPLKSTARDLRLFEWTPPPKVVPFPLVRRRSIIRNAARSMAKRGHELGANDPVATGEKMLAATLKRQREHYRSGAFVRRRLLPRLRR